MQSVILAVSLLQHCTSFAQSIRSLTQPDQHPPQNRILLRLIPREHLRWAVTNVLAQFLARAEAPKIGGAAVSGVLVVDDVDVNALQVLKGTRVSELCAYVEKMIVALPFGIS